MNKEWSELNKTTQAKIKKEESFNSGIETLLTLRKDLMKQIIEFKNTLSDTEFSATPFINAERLP